MRRDRQLLLLALLFAIGGCQHPNYRSGSPFQPNAPANSGVQPVPFPGQSAYGPPVNSYPAQAAYAPPFNPFPPSSLEPPGQMPFGGFNPQPPANYQTPPDHPQVTLGTPQPDSPPDTPSAEAQLNATQDPPQAPLAQSRPPAPEVVYPLPADRTPTSPPARIPSPASLPAGIPEFTVVRDGVAGGLRPMLDGGLDWLQSQGYRTVLHLKNPGEDDSADRKQVQKRGMKYLSLEVSPSTLSPRVVQEFVDLVADQKNYPLFVYDRKGTLAGGLWYLYFRSALSLADEEARGRAAALGLREHGDDAHREMWLAVQDYLSKK